MILAGDVGGTKTLLGLFSEAPDRPTPIEVGEFATLEYDGVERMIGEFLRAWNVETRHLQSACIGVAGAITSQVARMTNVPWVVDAAAVSVRTGIKSIRILNDLEALAYAVAVLEPAELAWLQDRWNEINNMDEGLLGASSEALTRWGGPVQSAS